MAAGACCGRHPSHSHDYPQGRPLRTGVLLHRVAVAADVAQVQVAPAGHGGHRDRRLLIVTGTLFCEFFATHDIYERDSDYILCPPQRVHFVDADGRFHLRPFVYRLTTERNMDTFALDCHEDIAVRYPIHLLVRGDEYKLWGLFPGRLHLLGIRDEGAFYLFGTDNLGATCSRACSTRRASRCRSASSGW